MTWQAGVSASPLLWFGMGIPNLGGNPVSCLYYNFDLGNDDEWVQNSYCYLLDNYNTRWWKNDLNLSIRSDTPKGLTVPTKDKIYRILVNGYAQFVSPDSYLYGISACYLVYDDQIQLWIKEDEPTASFCKFNGTRLYFSFIDTFWSYPVPDPMVYGLRFFSPDHSNIIAPDFVRMTIYIEELFDTV